MTRTGPTHITDLYFKEEFANLGLSPTKVLPTKKNTPPQSTTITKKNDENDNNNELIIRNMITLYLTEPQRARSPVRRYSTFMAGPLAFIPPSSTYDYCCGGGP